MGAIVTTIIVGTIAGTIGGVLSGLAVHYLEPYIDTLVIKKN